MFMAGRHPDLIAGAIPAHGVVAAPNVKIVDEKDKIEAFMPVVDEAVGEGLATLEKVEIRFYRSRKQQKREDEE